MEFEEDSNLQVVNRIGQDILITSLSSIWKRLVIIIVYDRFNLFQPDLQKYMGFENLHEKRM